MSEEYANPYSGELVPVTQVTNRTVDLRDRATDSWTDVASDVIKLAEIIAPTEFVPTGLRGSQAKVTAAILYSRELGLAPMTGLGSTHVIEGKAGISAELMRALILQTGHDLEILESTREVCRMRGRRRGSETWTEASWTIQEARNTKVFLSKEKGWGALASKSQWVSWPADMLLARATTRLARMIFPDVIHGLRSTEELQDMSEVEEVAVPGIVAAAPAPVQRRRVAAPKPRGQVPAPAPAEQSVQEAPVKSAPPAADDEPADAEVVEEHAPVQRLRVAPPRPRGQAPRPEPEAKPPAEEHHQSPEPASVVIQDDDPVSEGQVQAIVMHLQGRLGVTDREDRLYWAAIAAGIDDPTSLGSTKDLTQVQARAAIDRLGRVRDRAGLDALLPADVASEGGVES